MLSFIVAELAVSGGHGKGEAYSMHCITLDVNTNSGRRRDRKNPLFGQLIEGWQYIKFKNVLD